MTNKINDEEMLKAVFIKVMSTVRGQQLLKQKEKINGKYVYTNYFPEFEEAERLYNKLLAEENEIEEKKLPTKEEFEQERKKALTYLSKVGKKYKTYIYGDYRTATKYIYYRISSISQSKRDIDREAKRYYELHKTEDVFVFATVSSSFKDKSFLRFLAIVNVFSIDRKVEISVSSIGRTEIETVTRNLSVAVEIVEYAKRWLLKYITIQGVNVLTQPSLFMFMVGVLGNKWVENANTKIAAKHLNYYKIAKLMSLNKRLAAIDYLNSLKKIEYEEFFALLQYNATAEKVVEFFNSLVSNSITNYEDKIDELEEKIEKEKEELEKEKDEKDKEKYEKKIEKLNKKLNIAQKALNSANTIYQSFVDFNNSL